MTASTHATSGRPRLFDEDGVLEELTALFWRKGYTQTSVADLVEASGVHKPSLYRTFGSKEQLFATVLRRYLAARAASFAALIDRAGPGIEGIHAFLDMFEADAVSGAGRRGCLLVMASNELCGTLPGYEDFADQYRQVLREQIGVLVARAQPEDDPNRELIEQRTDLFTTYLLGLQVTIRSGAHAREIHRFINAMHATVDTWRPTTAPA